MTAHAGITARHVNTYHQSNSLLFQFILAEFLESFSELQRLDALFNRTAAPLPAEDSLERYDEGRRLQIEQALTKLVGSTRDYMRLFSWNFCEGLLPKLKTYSALFLQNTDSDQKEMLALQHYADKVWQGCMHAIDAFYDASHELKPLVAALEKAIAAMQRFSKLLSRALHHFKDDENVIFYVVRHHCQFDKLYGSRFVAKLLTRLYPKGTREAQQFLIKKYLARGFDNVVPAIQANIAEIEASAL